MPKSQENTHLTEKFAVPRKCLTLAALAFAATNAQADLYWDFSGFASIGAGRLSEDNIEFMEYDHEWSFDTDSILGMQWIVQPIDRFSVTAQIVARGFTFDSEKHYDPEFEWFFASYELTPDVRVRAGRLRTPHYLFSESLEIGYSYPWARPPVDMYVFFLEPFSHFDGMDINLQHQFGDVDTELRLFYGEMKGEFIGVDIDVDQVYGLASSARWKDFTFRYAVNVNNVELALSDARAATKYVNMAAAIHPAFKDLDQYFYNDGENFLYHGLGIQWERGNWNITAEKFLFKGPDEQFSFDSDGWYLSLSRQWGNWMPYAVYGEYKAIMDHGMADAFRNTYAVYPEGGTTADDLFIDRFRAAAIASLESRNARQSSQTVGIRYDFLSNMDVKFEIQHFDFEDQSTGHLLSLTTKENNPESAILTTIMFDLVF